MRRLIQFAFLFLLALCFSSVAHAQAPVAGTKTCGNFGGATPGGIDCFWSTALATGEGEVCAGYGNANGTWQVINSPSNTYLTPEGTPILDTFNGYYMQFFYLAANPGGDTSTQIVYSVPGAYPILLCDSVTGMTGPDTGVSCAGGYAASTGAVSCGTSMVTTSADYVFCVGVGYPATLSAGAGFTLGAIPYSWEASEYLVQGSPGTLTPTIVNGTSAYVMIDCVAFKGTAVAATMIQRRR